MWQFNYNGKTYTVRYDDGKMLIDDEKDCAVYSCWISYLDREIEHHVMIANVLSSVRQDLDS